MLYRHRLTADLKQLKLILACLRTCSLQKLVAYAMFHSKNTGREALVTNEGEYVHGTCFTVCL